LPEEFFFNETSDPAKLNNRQRGQLAELGFMRKAASLGLSIAKPWNEGERYDFIARVEKVCWRIQVKSVWAKQPQRNYYRFTTSSRSGLTYSADEIDFVVAYIFREDTWYVLPVREVENRKSMCVMPGSKRSRYEQYREAWKLMKPACVQPAAIADAAPDAGASAPAKGTDTST
jgi:chlorite dismutase